MTNKMAFPLTLLLTAFLLITILALSLLIGRSGGSLLGGVFWWDFGSPELANIVLEEVRLPRSLLAMMTGATLGLCGAALQGLFRNPLAEPGIIGASGSAALGAVIVLYYGIGGDVVYTLPTGGILGAVAGLFLVYALAGGRGDVTTLILAGVAINTFSGALTSLALNLAPSPYATLEILFWMMGSVADRSFDQVWIALPFMTVGWLMILACGRGLDALSIGEQGARSLGINLTRVKFCIICGTALAVGAAVSVTGAIGFVGLTVPHIIRPFVQHRPGHLLLPSALGGAILLLAADIVVRMMPPGPELKLGVVTALVGAPFFIGLLLRLRAQNT